MSIRKKLLIALLSTTVAVAGTASLAACKDDKPTNPPPGSSTEDEVTVSDEAYEIAAANGTTGTKDEWLADLKSTYAINGKDIKSVSANADGNVVITYTDNTDQTINMAVKIFKVICKDQLSGAPVKDVWFEIGYQKGYTFTYTEAATSKYAKSDENGVVTFFVTPEDGIDYSVRIALDPDQLAAFLNVASVDILPNNYKTAFGTKNGLAISILSFDSSRKAEALFENVANDFYQAEKTRLNYTASVTPNTVEVTADVFRYVYFEPSTSGKYTFTITNPASGATLYKLAGSRSLMPKNDKNVPVADYVTGGTKDAEYDNGANYDKGIYTGSNSIELNITRDIVEREIFFSILTSADCDVTITVERTGDAEEEAPVEETIVQAPATIAKFEEKPENTSLTLMPVSGSLSTVLGDDGYYHVGAKDGPKLLIQLNKALPRVATEAISKMPEIILPGSDEPQGDSALTFNIRENGKLTAIRNYAGVIAKYAAKANSDGVYGVDETLYNFLKDYGASGQAIGTDIGNPNNWLLPCQYYQPAGGLQVSGSGTEIDPYIINSGTNSVDLYEAAYLSFTAADKGIYTFRVNQGTIKNTSGYTSTYNDSNVLYVCVNDESGNVSLYIEGTGSTTVTVAYVDAENRNISAEYTDTIKGTSDNPADIMPGINNVIISDSANKEGVWVNFNSPALVETAEFEFKIYDDTLQIVYNGNIYDWKNTLKLTLEDANTEIKLLITTKKNGEGKVIDGNYLLNIKLPGNELTEGNNSISFKSETEAYNGILYSFTSLTGGIYTMSVPEGCSALITDEENPDITFIDGYNITSYVFKAEAGQTIKFLVGALDETPYILTIEEGGVYNDPSPLVLRVAREVIIPVGEDGFHNTLGITDAGTYVITLEITDGSTNDISALYQLNERTPATKVNLQRSGNVFTAEFTLSDSNVNLANGDIGIYLTLPEQADKPVSAKLTISLKQN